MKRKNHAGPTLRIWVTLIVLATLAVSGGGYWYYRSETERIQQQKYDEIAAIGKLKAGQIQQWRQERLGDIWRISKAPFFGQGLREWLSDVDNIALRAKVQGRLAIEQKEKGYADVLLLDTECRVLLSAEPQPHPLSPAARQAIAQALANRAPMLSDLYRCPRGFVHVDAVAPFLDPEGRPIAVLVLRSNAESALYPLIQSWPTPSRTAETLLVRKDGDGILFLNDLRHRPNSALSLREPLTLLDLPAVQAVLGKQGPFQGRDYRGVEVLADLLPIRDSPWFMVAKVDTSEILAEARYRGAMTAVFVALFILLAGSATAYGYRYRQARLYQDLYRSERDQRQAEEQFRTILYSIGDAVITTDTRGVVKQMNPVAEALTGWPENEAIGRPLEEVFFIINQETRQACENPVQKVLKDGQVVGLANHAVLIDRNGTERVLADSGAPIRAEDGEILGVVLVFRDVTDRARAEEELRNREETLRAILAASPIGIVLTQDRRIKWANDSWARMFGFDSAREYLDQPTSLMHPSGESYESVRKILYDNVKIGQVSQADARLKRKDGTLFEGNIRINLVNASDPSRGTISAITDISERKRAEEAIRENERMLSSILTASPVGIGLSVGRKMRWVNDVWAKMFGFAHASDCVGLESRKLYESDEAYDRAGRILYKNLEAGVINEIDTPMRRLDGSPFDAYVRMTALDPEDVSAGQLAVITDISERKRGESDLRASEERYRSLFENMLEGFAYCKMLFEEGKPKDFIYLDVNNSFERLTGLKNVVGKRVTEVIPGIRCSRLDFI